MSRIELTLKAAYLPNWGVVEAVRELLQNARDAETQDGAKMTVEHVYRMRDKRPVGALIICNEGTTIDKEALLIGHTTKLGHQELIGQYGEGLKFGILAALRLGLQIKIRNGSETWIPVITRSKQFEADVLAFDITTGHKDENRVQVEVLGLELDTWNQLKKNFLFLSPPNETDQVTVPFGRILINPEYKGKIFVKGMFVCTDDQLSFGYDLKDADLDRDRRMINDRAAAISRLLHQAVESGKLTDSIYQLLHQNAYEVSNLCYYAGDFTKDAMVSCFLNQYGEEALPVETDEEANLLSHFGKRGVKVPYGLRSILISRLGTAKKNIDVLRMGTKHIYLPEELNENEKIVFNSSLALLKEILTKSNLNGCLAESVEVVDFADSNLMGTFDFVNNSIRLARGVLKTDLDTDPTYLRAFAKTLRVLIHEAAHYLGVDGSTEHKLTMEDLMEVAFQILLKPV